MQNIDVNCMPRVAILLSTYNGVKYVSMLLDSLLKQDYVNFTINIRDDGSSDKTVEILRAYSSRDSRVNLSVGENLGCIGSFLHLLASVDADIYMFCDQDDVWMPTKVSTATTALIKHGLNLPVLFHSDLIVVDKKLDIISSSFMYQQGLKLPNSHKLEILSIQNCVVGCTTAITKSLATLLSSVALDSKKIAMHDWWIALVAKTHGHIIYSPIAEILYRQHESNVSGAQRKSFFKRLKTQFSYSGLNRINIYRQRVAVQAKTFLDLYEETLENQAKKVFLRVIEIHPDRGSCDTIVAMLMGIRFQNMYMNFALLYTSIVTNLLRLVRIK